MAAEYPHIDKFLESYSFIADWPKESVVGKRCKPPHRQPCSYGEFCVCAAYEAVWLKLNEEQDGVDVEISQSKQNNA